MLPMPPHYPSQGEAVEPQRARYWHKTSAAPMSTSDPGNSAQPLQGQPVQGPNTIQVVHGPRAQISITKVGATVFIVSNGKGECLSVKKSMDDAMHYIHTHYIRA